MSAASAPSRAAAPAFELSIVVPVYNGARTLPELVTALGALEVDGGHEIVLVNDGSRDDSLVVCRELCRKSETALTVVNLARNFGEHNAVMAGFAHARGAFIVNVDDDLQNPPGEILRLYRHCRDRGHDVVYASYATKHHSLFRNLGSGFANRCADLVLDKPKGLYLSSFRCMNAFTARSILSHAGPFPYIDGLVIQVTQNLGCLEVEHQPRAEGRSEYTVARLLRLYFSMLLNFSVAPLRVATAVGVVIGALGLLGCVAVIVEALAGGTPQGWASTMAATLLLAGVELTMLGVIGEYLGRLFLTVNGKPQFVIRDVERNERAGGSPAGHPGKP
jgi:undecaprenyl-phosphate 4-deoxy-4-formamido-L-arabinose transferase